MKRDDRKPTESTVPPRLAAAGPRFYNRRMRLTWFAVALVLAVGSVGAAKATSVREKQSSAMWRTQDDCARAAFLKFPDYTPESNAKRDQATRACEIKNHVPARAPVIISPVKRIPDAAAD